MRGCGQLLEEMGFDAAEERYFRGASEWRCCTFSLTHCSVCYTLEPFWFRGGGSDEYCVTAGQSRAAVPTMTSSYTPNAEQVVQDWKVFKIDD